MVMLMIPASGRKYFHMRIKYTSGGKTSFFYEVNKSKELVESLALQIDKLVSAIRFEGHRLYPTRVNEYKIFVTESPSEMNPESIRDEHPEGYDFGGNDVTLEISKDTPIPTYQCQKCDAPVNPTDEKCPNGHDLSIVGKKIKLLIKDEIKFTDSLSLKSGFVVNQIESEVKALAIDPNDPETEERWEVIKGLLEILADQGEERKDEHAVIIDQTSPLTLFQRIQENAMDHVITSAIILALTLLALMFG